MKRIMAVLRSAAFLELLGLVLLFAGVMLAGGIAAFAVDERFVVRDRQRLLEQLDGMKAKLVAAKVPEDQIPGLLRVYRSVFAEQLGHQHVMVCGVLMAFSLLIASFGFSLILLGKLRALGAGRLSSAESMKV